MGAPSGLVLRCEDCGVVGAHRVLRGRVGGRDEVVFDGVVKCVACGRVRHVVTREPRPLLISVIVSTGSRSSRTTVEVGPEEILRVGGELDLPEGRVRITAIESADRRVPEAAAAAVQAVWAVKLGKVRVPVSVTLGSRTTSRQVLAAPDEEFLVGDIIELESTKAVIHSIRTRRRTLRTGAAPAADIVRVYGRQIRERARR